ncbi:MAG: terpene cyclase/mutase family protein [Herbinix sp.]|nr:terpene cyclase/mutase family protein [Herbinix sp.]
MKNKVSVLCKKIICVLLLVSIITGISNVEVSAKSSQYTASDLEKVIDGILAYKQNQSNVASVQELIDNTLVKNAGKGSAEWFVIALSQYKDEYDYTKYHSALSSYIKANKTIKATDMQRIALAYSATGGNDKFIKKTIKDSIGKLGVMSYIYGLILLDAKSYTSTEYTREKMVDEILSLRLSDGGWALSGKASDVDITAMALQALAPYYKKSDVKAAVDESLLLLSEKQLKNGDYKSWGTRSCESVAQVITALSALNIDCQKDKRFIKNKKTIIDGLMLYKLKDGSFCHTIDGETNDTSSVQAMYALIAVWRQRNGMNSFYTFSNTGTSNSAIKDKGSTEQVNQVADTSAGNINSENLQAKMPIDINYKAMTSFLILIVVLMLLGIYLLRKNQKRIPR